MTFVKIWGCSWVSRKFASGIHNSCKRFWNRGRQVFSWESDTVGPNHRVSPRTSLGQSLLICETVVGLLVTSEALEVGCSVAASLFSFSPCHQPYPQKLLHGVNRWISGRFF